MQNIRIHTTEHATEYKIRALTTGKVQTAGPYVWSYEQKYSSANLALVRTDIYFPHFTTFRDQTS